MDDKNEIWALGTATAVIEQGEARLTVVLRGIVTAAAYEALHTRIGRERPQRRRHAVRLVVDDDALLVATPKSLAQAAGRGTPADHTGPAFIITVAVPSWRLRWAVLHCLLLTGEGLLRSVELIDRQVVEVSR